MAVESGFSYIFLLVRDFIVLIDSARETIFLIKILVGIFGKARAVGFRFVRFFDNLNVGRKTIAAPSEGFDKRFAVAPRTERFAKDVKIMLKVRFLNDRTRPNRFNQFVLADDFAALVNQREQRFDRLRNERNLYFTAIKHPVRRVQTIFIKDVNYSFGIIC